MRNYNFDIPVDLGTNICTVAKIKISIYRYRTDDLFIFFFDI
jgi:hypothetical protein